MNKPTPAPVKKAPSANIKVSVLPADAADAVRRMIKFSQNLLDLAERETQALLHQDALSFGVLQDEKEGLAHQYTTASEEFRSRLNQFRRVDKALIKQLEALQNRLSEKTRENMAFVERMRTKAEKSASKTLFTVQELAQSKPVRFQDQQNNTHVQQGA